ncbi:MAG: branched-chain amino acid ABC transporter permease, partial [Geminicoccaceae bacterium]
MPEIFDIYLLEALVNGLLLGGVLALLALGLNLVFGVIDVIWICYTELVMFGMYGVYWLNAVYGVPLVLAGALAILLVAGMGFLLHLLVISPILDTPPINQLLATGGVLFFLQSLATLLFGIAFRNLGLRLPILEIAGMYISFARLLAFGAALAGMICLYLFLTRTFVGTAIRAVSQDREAMALMGASPQRIYVVTSAVGGAMAGIAAALLSIQYSV